MSELSELRKEAMERAGDQCEWAACGSTLQLQMAHLVHRGMGGSPKANTLSNVCILCIYHHDVLDGRTVKGRKFTVATLLDYYLRTRR